jgi:hypothetical protein
MCIMCIKPITYMLHMCIMCIKPLLYGTYTLFKPIGKSDGSDVCSVGYDVVLEDGEWTLDTHEDGTGTGNLLTY